MIFQKIAIKKNVRFWKFTCGMWDNAFAESSIKTLKWEEVYLNEYGTFEDAFRNICRFIENVYNRKRLYSSLGYKSPDQFEMETALNTIA